MSMDTQLHSRRRAGKPLTLPAFSFPNSAPIATEQLETPKKNSVYTSPIPPPHILEQFPATQSGETVTTIITRPSHGRHRRSHAVSTSMQNNTLRSQRTSLKHQGMYVPPVPEIPAMYRQLSGRSISDVSTCPTLETDSGATTSEPVSPSAQSTRFDDVRSSISSAASMHTDITEPHSIDTPTTTKEQAQTKVEEVEADDEQDDEDDDDDEEFWHCRGITESAPASRKPSFADWEQDKTLLDVAAWARSIDSAFASGTMWLDTPSLTDDDDTDTDFYMQLMQHPLLAPQ